jgi:hypothetical protein
MAEARAEVRELEEREMRRGYKLPDARKRVAGRVGASPGTFRSLALGRLKKFDAALRDRIRALLIRELEQEVGRLAHEIETHKRAGARANSSAVGEAETHLEAAKALLRDAAP